MILYYTYYYKKNKTKMSDSAFDLQAFLAKMDAEKAKTQLIQKAKDASQGFGAASSAIATLNVMMGTSLCPCCNK